MLKTLSLMSSEEANNCKERADTLRAYYQQSVASQYNLNEALDALVTLTDISPTEIAFLDLTIYITDDKL